MKATPFTKLIALMLVGSAAVGGWRMWSRLAPAAPTAVSVVPGKIDLPSASFGDGGGQYGTSAVPVVASLGGGEVRLLGYAWNAQMGLMFANGGPTTAPDSIMRRHDVNLHFIRQDDNGKMQEALVAFATELSQGAANPEKGAHFVTIMGDGSASFLQGLNETLGRLGPGYQAKIVDAIGYSRGEDKLMGPAEWKTNPNAARGSLVAGVIRDGDWNIAQKWLGDNSIPTNPDEKTYDPNAMNWVNASDYVDAAQKYVAGYSEDRPVVVNGKPTGEIKHITVDGCVTWTPGDVTVAEKRGGLVSVVSTREYNTQMPCVIIGIDKWMRANRPTVDRMIEAIAEGSQQVKSSDAALAKAAIVADQCYNEPGTGPAYWVKYFKGAHEQDAAGETVELGGSSVNNLADTMFAFGLAHGSADLVSATYTVFGNLDHAEYPDLVEQIAPASEVVDKSYVVDASREVAPAGAQVAAARPSYNRPAQQNVVGHRIWHIHFEPGSATFSADARKLLGQLASDLLIAGGTVVEVHGYTDNQGRHETSLPLSEARAAAVQRYLETSAPANFPKGRVRTFAHGEANPVASNGTADGRAQNRRVEIVLRSLS